MIQKILLADSGIGLTTEMLKSLRDLPTIQEATITILHVVPRQVTTEAMEDKMAEGEKILAQTVEKLDIESDRVETMLRQGDPKDTVCKVAEDIKADLIIMGSRGLKRLESILANSVSQYVFQLTNRPMLLVKDDIYVKKLKRVMVALDKSDVAQHALELALFLLRGYKDAELILARVNPDLDPKLLPLSKAEMENNPVVAEALNLVKRQGVNYRCVVTGGRPSQEICKLADENDVDLLIMGSPDRRPSIAKGLPDLDRLLGTSLSDYIRVNANCPVLLARQ